MSLGGLRDAGKVWLTRSPRVYEAARRPYALARYCARRPHDRGYEVFRLFDRDGLFLDVGANAGMSAYSFRLYNRAPILSIEPNPFHERDLQFAGRIVRRHSYRMWAAGSHDQELMLHVPVYRDVPITAEASLVREEVASSWSLRRRLGKRIDTGDFRIVSVTVPVRPLDCLELAPAYIKLDVQGFEYEALLGLRSTLARSRPVLLIETPSSDVRDLLGDLGYSSYGFEPSRRALAPSGSFGFGDTVFLAA